MSDIPTISCLVCGAGLKVNTCTSKAGKVALVLVCPRDGSDFGAFINNQEYIREVFDSLEMSKAQLHLSNETTSMGSTEHQLPSSRPVMKLASLTAVRRGSINGLAATYYHQESSIWTDSDR